MSGSTAGASAIQGDLWSAAARDWATIQEPQHAPLWEAMIAAADIHDGSRVLDAGCGGGGASALLAARGARVCGIDAAPGLIEIAARRVPDGTFVVGDIQELPYDDDGFDAILAANAVQFTSDPVATLREFSRVGAPGARMVAGNFGPPGKVAYRGVLDAVRKTLPQPPLGDGPFALSAPGALESLFESADMTISTAGDVDCPFRYPDMDTFVRAALSGGPVQAALRAMGRDRLRRALEDVAARFEQDDGSIVIAPNLFHYVAASA